jgi:hypothetical protein
MKPTRKEQHKPYNKFPGSEQEFSLPPWVEVGVQGNELATSECAGRGIWWWQSNKRERSGLSLGISYSVQMLW